MILADRNTGADPNASRRVRLKRAGFCFCRFGFRDDPLSALEQAGADFSQAELACGSVQEARTQAVLQSCDLFRNGGFGNAQFLRRSGKTTGLNDPYKDRHGGKIFAHAALLRRAALRVGRCFL
jgi:hypothetical protein